MHKLIPTIYFYTVSLIGLVILIIGIFASIHYIVNTIQYPVYPLGYGVESRCGQLPAPVKGETQPLGSPSYANCLQDVEQERQQLKTQDLEKSISFTLIGALVFGIHFYFARKQSTKPA